MSVTIQQKQQKFFDGTDVTTVTINEPNGDSMRVNLPKGGAPEVQGISCITPKGVDVQAFRAEVFGAVRKTLEGNGASFDGTKASQTVDAPANLIQGACEAAKKTR